MELGQVQVREVMVPRPDVHALPANANLEDTMKMFATTQRSRIPVYEGTLDHILGFVHIKDLIWILLERARRAEEQILAPEFHLRSLLRDVLIVPETKPASELLLEFRARRTGLAMVVDEFGSILGLATLEDILEQMVGEIHDEFDVVERPLTLPDGSMIFDAALNVRDLQVQYNISIPDDPSYETIGGFILNRLGFIPRGGESFEAEGFRFTVMEMDHRRISRVKIKALRVAPATLHSEAAPAPAADGIAKIASLEKHTPAPRAKAKAAAKGRRESNAKAGREAGRETDPGSGREQ
jgi:putative hemolysin